MAAVRRAMAGNFIRRKPGNQLGQNKIFVMLHNIC